MRTALGLAVCFVVGCGAPSSSATGSITGKIVHYTGVEEGLKVTSWTLDPDHPKLDECDSASLCPSTFRFPISPWFKGEANGDTVKGLMLNADIESAGQIPVCEGCVTLRTSVLNKVGGELGLILLPAGVEHVHFTGNIRSPLEATVVSKGHYTSDGNDLTHDMSLKLDGNCGGPSLLCGNTIPEQQTLELAKLVEANEKNECPAELQTAFGTGMTMRISAKELTLGDGAPLPCVSESSGTQAGVKINRVMCGGEKQVTADGCTWTVDLIGSGGNLPGPGAYNWPIVFINGVASADCARPNGRYCNVQLRIESETK